MNHASVVAVLSRLSEPSLGVFRGRAAVAHGVTRKQLSGLVANGTTERVHPDVYRMTVVERSSEQTLRAALLWGGEQAAGAGRSAGEVYELDRVHATAPEIVVPRDARFRCTGVVVHRSDDRRAMRIRHHRGIAHHPRGQRSEMA